ncbi:MAG: winged helix-turn-helix domain-containing protein [Acidobacteria bacterium]|nr:winged helix-turn-helix domain-containing protein [Acidobacteriota bacterium]
MTYTFGVFVFDAQALELTRDGRRVALEPQPARALALLVARAGEVVARDDMRQAIWGAETHVDYDRGLAYCIGQVRSALGDSAEQPRFVQTLPKRGFRFLAPVGARAPVAASSERPMAPPVPTAPDPASPDVGVSAAVSAVAPAPPAPRPLRLVAVTVVMLAAVVVGWRTLAVEQRPVVAVSVFDNETGDPAYDAFVAGLSDVVVTELTNLAPSRLGVVGNAAALRRLRNIRNLKALATEVDADYVVLGQLQRQDDQLRFIVHLIRLSDEVHLWAQRFVRPADDVGGFEQDVVKDAVGAVRGFVLEAPRS